MSDPAIAAVEKSTTVRSEYKVPVALGIVRAGFGALSRVSPRTAAFAAERLFLTPRRHDRPRRERELTSTARRFSIASDDGALAAWEWGTAGERVLLVHGWEGRGTQLGAFVPPLVERGFRVVAFDAPAHGDSPGTLSSFFHFARSIARAARELEPLHGVIAHSMGGASAAWASRSTPLASRFVMIAPPADIRDFTSYADTMLGLTPRAVEELEARLGRRFGVDLAEVHASRVGPGMKAPLLVIHDQDDREVPIQAGELVAGSWPAAELVRTQGLGHRRILREPAVVARAVEFLSR
ncbi:MAG TPA: alpha/beta fold hydrolase [Polyangiaceae bacterium]